MEIYQINLDESTQAVAKYLTLLTNRQWICRKHTQEYEWVIETPGCFLHVQISGNLIVVSNTTTKQSMKISFIRKGAKKIASEIKRTLYDKQLSPVEGFIESIPNV